MRPPTLPGERYYEHATLARYKTGCRCEPCRAANRDFMRRRDELAVAAAREVSAPTVQRPQKWTRPDGTVAIRNYKRACPGVEGRPCPKNAHLRKDSQGGVCGTCRFRLPAVWNGIVPADRARKHLLKLRRKGIGRRAVADACDVAHTILMNVISGQKRSIRAQTERRILAVDVGAVADHALVDAGSTRRRIEQLMAKGYPKARLATLLGYESPRLQFREKVTAQNALRVERLYRQLTAEAKEPKLVDETWRDRLLGAYADGVDVEDLSRRFEMTPDAIMQFACRAGVKRPSDVA